MSDEFFRLITHHSSLITHGVPHRFTPSRTAHRTSARPVKKITARMTHGSADRTHTHRPRAALATLHGISPRRNVASSVPTGLARSDATGSPCMSRAKLVVMPQDGHGTPVSRRKLHSGNPSCVCVAIVRGVLTLDLTVAGGKVETVRVDMGEPILTPDGIPTTLPGERVIDAELPDWPAGRDLVRLLEPAGARPHVTCVCTGNPHAVIYCGDTAKVPLDAVGPVLEYAPVFPRRANIHFVQVMTPGVVTMRTWERGSGVTMACGTGASAVCVAGVLTGRTGRNLLAHLPGGDLRLEWSEADNHVYMTGPAVEVFSGDWPDA